MSDKAMTPENITWEDIKAWDGKTMHRYMAMPEFREAITKVVSSRSYQEIQDMVIGQENSTTVPEIKTEEIVITPESVVSSPVLPLPPPPPKKIVVEYQIRDEDGNPIGRPTHLEASSEEEMRDKMKEAHTQAARAFHRLKKQKVQSLQDVNKQSSVAQPHQEMSDAELMATLKDLRSEDPQTQLAAHKKLTQAEQAKKQAEDDAKENERLELERQKQVSIQFLQRHKHDFNQCQANIDLIGKYFEENNLPPSAWTLDNLEIAFLALEDRLAPVAAPAVEVTLAANPPAPQPAATPTAAPVVQPPPTVPAPPPPPANPVPAAPRPGVNGGIVPGQSSVPRPQQKPQGLTIEEILSWDGPTMRAKMRSPLRDEIIRVTNEAKLRRGR